MTKMNYGVPYQGSKNRIATLIMNELPAGKRFVDLFAGGCAMTHVAMLSGKYKRFLCNDLYPSGSNLFRNAMNGEYSKPEYLRWVSREEFYKEKDTDDFVKLCYSFGNGGITYLYGKKREPLKKGFHYAVVFNDWRYLEQYAKDNNWREGLIDELKKSVEGIHTTNERRLALHRCATDSGIQQPQERILVNLSRLTRLEELNYRLENLEMMNRLQNIDISTEQ